MKSPFPGMDPYLERRWGDVHSRMSSYIVDALSPLLPDPLRVRSEERILLEEFTPENRRLRAYRQADVTVTESHQHTGVAATAVMPETMPQPITVEYEDFPLTERWVQIIDTANGNRVVTAIEILSPGNKESGTLNQSYRRKLDDYARAQVSVVEIDLLRSSRERLAVTWDHIPHEARATYAVCIRRGWELDRWDAYPLSLRASLPPIPIPLRPQDQAVPLSLQPLIDRIYSIGRYDDIDYTQPPSPALNAEDEAWADDLLKRAERR